MVFHCRMGHFVWAQDIQALAQSGSHGLDDLKGVTFSNDWHQNCSVCASGKSRAQASSTSLPKEHLCTLPFELVHSYVQGSFRTTMFKQHCFCCTILDEATDMMWVYPIQSKDQVFDVFKQFSADVAIYASEYPLRRIRCDNGCEYTSHAFQNWAREKQILFEYSTAYHPQGNGQAELHQQTICQIAHCMMIDSGLGGAFWGVAICHAAHLYNISSVGHDGSTPFQRLHGKPPNFCSIRVFGCRAWIHACTEDSVDPKFSDRAVAGVYVGNGPGHLYHVWIPSTHKMVTTVNVRIGESEMQYQDEDLVSPLFPECTGNPFPVALHHPPQPLAPQPPQQRFLWFHSDSNMFEILNTDSTVSEKSQKEVYQTLQDMAKKVSDSLHSPATNCTKLLYMVNTVDQVHVESSLRSHPDAPNTHAQAMQSPEVAQWKAAEDKELELLHARGVFTAVQKSSIPGVKVLHAQWVYTVKPHNVGVQYKARLVAWGDQQLAYEHFNPLGVFSTVLNNSCAFSLVARPTPNGMFDNRIFHRRSRTVTSTTIYIFFLLKERLIMTLVWCGNATSRCTGFNRVSLSGRSSS